jgi:hypothetical protein
MDVLQQHLSALDAFVAGLPQDDGLVAEDLQSKEIIGDHMRQIIALPGGAVALVMQYRADERAVVIRSLAFLLAVTVNDRHQANALAKAVLVMIEGLRTDDPWARLNLCSAIQRLLMFGAIPPGSATVAATLPRFLRESLDGPPALRATAATVVADLFYGRHTDLVPEVELANLRTKLLALVDDPDELTRKEAQGLREFLEEADPSSET